MSQQLSRLSQAFDCEIDDRDWISCKLIGNELVISLILGEEEQGGITLGSGQIQNLIEFLQNVNEELCNER